MRRTDNIIGIEWDVANGDGRAGATTGGQGRVRGRVRLCCGAKEVVESLPADFTNFVESHAVTLYHVTPSRIPHQAHTPSASVAAAYFSLFTCGECGKASESGHRIANLFTFHTLAWKPHLGLASRVPCTDYYITQHQQNLQALRRVVVR